LLGLPGGAKSDLKLHKALDTPGFMESQELIWLAVQARAHHRILELGSFLGRSTRALADNTAGVVYAADDWNGLRDQDWPSELATELATEVNANFRENCLLGFMTHLQDHIESGKVRVVHADHSLSEGWPPFPDMVFVDGDHRYENCKRDIENALLRLRPGGLLCGHDRHWPGVKQAVAELLPGSVEVPNTSIWAYIMAEQPSE
jgi:predicted O-methyltransferase YrrM